MFSLSTVSIVKNISWLFFDKLLRILGGLLISVWLARYLGPNDFGILSYALAYTALFVIFSHLGLNQIVVREIVKNKELSNSILGTAFILKLIGGAFAIVAIATTLQFTDTDNLTRSIILITSIGLVFSGIDVIDFFYQSQILSKYVVIARNSAFILSGSFKIYLIIFQYDLIYFAWANLFDVISASILLIIIYKSSGYRIFKWRYSHKLAKRLLGFSWPLGISVCLVTIHLKVDQLMIGSMLDADQVGIYSVAAKITETWIFIPTIIISTLIPYFVSLRETDSSLYKARLIQLYSFMFWFGVSISVLSVFLGKTIIIVLFGAAYSDAYIALSLNIWAIIFMSQSAAKSIWVISENKQVYGIIVNGMGVIVNIGMNFLLIPKYGINGAAIATLLTRLATNWLIPLFIKPYRENTWNSIKSVNPFYLHPKVATLKNHRS